MLLQSVVEWLAEQVCKTSRLPGLESTSLKDMLQWAGEQPHMHCRSPRHCSQCAARLGGAAAWPLLSLCRNFVCVLQEAAEAEPVHGIPGLLLADGELLEEQKTSARLQHSTSTVGRSVQLQVAE